VPLKSRFIVKTLKYLFFIILISAGCRDSWRPKPETNETVKVDSTFVVETDSTGLNLVVFNKEKYFFTGFKSESTVLRRIADGNILDSLIRDAKDRNKDVDVYHDVSASVAEFRDLIETLKQRGVLKFRIVSDDKLSELRIEK